MSPKSILPIILCGGSGTRLWPLSRQSFPKQFLSLNSQDNKSLIQQTIIRIKNLKNIEDPIFICNEEHRFIVAEQMREIGVSTNSIILEPFGRNTAAAITIAALKAIENGKDPNLLVLSSDHSIRNVNNFVSAINCAIKYSEDGRLVTFGIKPDHPATGYGYIKSERPIENTKIEGSNIDSFIEKPDKKKAESFIKDERFTWNSGIFLFKASKILKSVQEFSPDTLEYCSNSINKSKLDLDFLRLNQDYFKKCPNISIDVAVMEKTDKGTVIPLDAGWCDIGSWNSLWEISKKDNNGNFIKGKVEIKDSEGCYLNSDNRLIAAIGIKNLIVVETSDAILIADKNKSQEVKYMVDEMKNEKKSEAIQHQKNFRPWGNYESLIKEKKWQVKLINVKAGESLSLQKHQYRSEHWVVVSGEANVEINEKKFTLKENQSTYIPLGCKHRLSNKSKNNLVIIEIQSGSYLGEDDIERFEDNYGRDI